MNGLIICTSNKEYYGIGQLDCFAEYLEDKAVGSDIQKFIELYADSDTQQIEITPFSIYDAKILCEKISKKCEPCRVIFYCDIEEELDSYQYDFIGYDVCADDYYTSPLGMNYLNYTDDFEIFEDLPFFENISNEVRFDYARQINEFGLFDSTEPAGEIAEYCNWLCKNFDDMFYGAKDFKLIKIYLPK